jgi:hypothetical protein
MNTKPILIFLMLVMATLLSAQNKQKGDTIIIESETKEIVIPAKKIPIQQIPKQAEEISQVNKAIQKELNDYVLEMKSQKFISDNVVTEVNVEKVSNDLKIVYSYYLINDTLKFQTDDFGLGKYRVDESNALQVTLGIMKKTVEGQLAKYVTPQTRVSLTVNGSADATPVRSTIVYKGEFGNPVNEICTFETGPTQMEISMQKGISDNSALAFVRSYAVKDFMENNIEPLKSTNNKWQYSASVSRERGGKFRRVSIEMIVYDALKTK